MKTYFSQQALFALVMTFLVWSCGAYDPNIESAREALAQADYEEVIRSAEASIESNPENGIGYFYKGIAYASIAQNMDPANRVDDYATARSAFMEAKQRYEEQMITDGEAAELPDIILELWGFEYNSGIELLTDDIVSSHEDSLQLSRYHFINASTINPDSVHSYNLLAEVNFTLGNFEEAEEITRHIIYEMGEGDLFNYYRLSYYLMDVERDEEAIEVLLEAREQYPDEVEVVQEIANAYLRMGETDKALEVVTDLMEVDPDNPEYRLVYATQIYQMVEELDRQIRDVHDEMYDMSRAIRDRARQPGVEQAEIEQMVAELDKKQDEVNELIEESFRFSDEAEEQLVIALRSNPDNPDVHSTLGIVYQNRAAVLHDQRNMTDDTEEAEMYDKQAREYLEKALPHYEKAAEMEENNTDHWRSLFRVYTNLGMEEEAQKAQERAGL